MVIIMATFPTSFSCQKYFLPKSCTVILEIFGGFNFGHFRISPVFFLNFWWDLILTFWPVKYNFYGMQCACAE